jgi:recombination protein RecT
MTTQNVNGQAPAKTNGESAQSNNAPKKFEETTVDLVLSRITEFQKGGDLKLPSNYSPENAIRSAWLILQDVKNLDKRPALEVCTRESVANALLDMVLQGLSPVKKQCYFVVYGNKLQLQKSYIGTIAISKRVAGVKEVKAVPVYEGDVFRYEVNITTGRKKVIEHKQEFANIDPDKCAGAYAIVTEQSGESWTEVMTMKQIRKAWEMGNAKGNSPAHRNFADEMACKTVVNRALKIAIGSSDDGDLFLEEDQFEDAVTANVKHQISEHANKKDLSMQEDTTAGENGASSVVKLQTGEQVDTTTGEVKEEEPGNNGQGTIQGPGF